MYRISLHAAHRIAQRRLKAEELLAALDGVQVRQKNGLTIFYDPSSRVALFIDLKTSMVVTALRLKRGKYRTYVSDRRRKGEQHRESK